MSRRGAFRVGLAVAVVGALLAARPVEAQEITGTWESRVWTSDRTGESRVSLQMEVDRVGRDGSNHGFSPAAGDLQGISLAQLRGDADDVEFRLAREAGTIVFRGDVDRGRGDGTFEFTPSDEYLRTMAGLGFAGIPAERQLLFATLDVTTDYVLEIHRLGYRAIGLEDLTRFAIHGVSPELIRGMNDLGYTAIPAEDLIRLRIHGVSPDWVRRVRSALGSR